MVIDLIVVGVIKIIVRRPRPSHNKKNDMAMGTNYGADQFSFPSGHSTRAVLMSTLLSTLIYYEMEFMYSVFFILLLHICSLVTCFSRVYLVRHYLSDVIAGACLGYFIYFILIAAIF